MVGSAVVPPLFGALGMFEGGTDTRDIVEAMLLTAFLGGTFASGSLALARKAPKEEDSPSEIAVGSRTALPEPSSIPDPLSTRRRERESMR